MAQKKKKTAEAPVPDLFLTPLHEQKVAVEEPEPPALGYLQLCIERRFHRLVQTKFEELTGLGPHDYWMHSDAGGAPKMENEENRAQYAYSHGVRYMGWSAHGAGCGGFKNPFHPHTAGDREIETALRATVMKKVFLYPDAQHYEIFATEDENGKAVLQWRGPIRLI
jgi:hypothetical protein